MARDLTKDDSNKALVQASFDRWKNATGGPFELLAPYHGPLLAYVPCLRLIAARRRPHVDPAGSNYLRDLR